MTMTAPMPHGSATDPATDAIVVRTYRPSDETAVLWLQRHGRLHGDPQDGDTTCLKDVACSDWTGRHHVLVIEVNGQVVGATAIDRQQELIARLRWLCVAPHWQGEQSVIERLVETATITAREHGCLKLVVHTSLSAAQVADFFQRLGFLFYRERVLGIAHVIEFYVNLYMQPGPKKRGDQRRKESTI